MPAFSRVGSLAAPGRQRHVILYLAATLAIFCLFLAALAGASLGAAGSIMQGVTRNPIASPGLTGVISSGCSYRLNFEQGQFSAGMNTSPQLGPRGQ